MKNFLDLSFVTIYYFFYMRKITVFILVFIAVFVLQNTGAFTKTDFDNVVDFSVTLKTLNQALDEGSSVKLDNKKFVVVYGTVASISFLNRKKDTFKARLELVSGEWVGLKDVKSYRVYVDFEGPDFYSYIPVRTPRKPNPKTVVKDSRVLITAKVLKPIDIPLSGRYWLLQGVYIRKIY